MVGSRTATSTRSAPGRGGDGRAHASSRASAATTDPRTRRLTHRPYRGVAAHGTRSANRTTAAQIAALRGAGYGDLGILDLAIAVADAHQWARLHRLAGLPAELVAVAG